MPINAANLHSGIFTENQNHNKNMDVAKDYLKINKEAWNKKTPVHFESDFYNNSAFIAGATSLKDIELPLLGDVSGKKILHLQCHFGQDSISLARMGADVTGVDLSDISIQKANELVEKTGVECRFIECDIYSLPEVLDEKFDIVFSTYGTIGWLPDLDKWSHIVSHFLKPGGRLIFAEFHPVVWMFDDEFAGVGYNYFNDGAIHEQQEGTYTNPEADIDQEYVMWNHGLAEVISNLINNGMVLSQFHEFDYSPYNCFNYTEEFELGKFRIKHFENNIPMVYSLEAHKPG
ncbi:MAG: ubiquinone/menaquinone biosynthesis C-methylase UbiE [Bacteroidia bacterium]